MSTFHLATTTSTVYISETEVNLKISEHKMLSFAVRKEIIENNNSLAVISLSKVDQDYFVQTL